MRGHREGPVGRFCGTKGQDATRASGFWAAQRGSPASALRAVPARLDLPGVRVRCTRPAVRRASETEHAVRRLTAEIDDLRKLNRSTAEHACAYLDLVQRTGWKPADLLQMQTALRRDLLWVESRLRIVRGRAKSLRRRLAACAKRTPASRDSVVQHMEMLGVRDRVLVLRRLLLRQIADAFAGLVLR